MNIEETKNKIDKLLSDRGLTEEGKEQAVRLLLYHLYTAIDIYRFMTFAEKNKAGYWYRVFRSSFSLRGFLKERKRKRDKEKSPLHPSYKERETMLKEKSEKMSLCNGRESNGLEKRQRAFWNELLQYEERYGREMLLKFYAKWAEETADKTMMLWETQKSWSTKLRLLAWSKRKYQKDDEAAELHLQQVKNRRGRQPTIDTARQQAIAQERQDDNVRLEQEIEERKRNAVSYNDWLAMKVVKEAENEKEKEGDEAG